MQEQRPGAGVTGVLLDWLHSIAAEVDDHSEAMGVLAMAEVSR